MSPSGLVSRSIRRGSNVWRDPGGKIRVARGLLQMSATNVGARIFAANTQRASIAGALIGNRLPFAGLLRYDNAVLLFLSEEASAQVFLDEVAVTGLTTSATAGRLRVAVPDGIGGYGVYDAGFDRPAFTDGDVLLLVNGTDPEERGSRNMAGAIGIAVARWRTATDAIGPPSEVFYRDVPADSAAMLGFNLPAADPGQDGYIFAGTRWKDLSGAIRIVRKIYTQPRGTFTATNGSPNITAGVGTFWTKDLHNGDAVTIDAASYFIASVTSDTTAVLDTNFVGSTNSGKTMTITAVFADWFDSELGSLLDRDIVRPPRAAGVLEYASRVLVWGCFGESSSSPTGPVILPMSEDNPEHCLIRGIRTTSGGDLVNVLGGDGPLYLMTTRGLEVVSFTGDPGKPYIPRVIAEPGFKAATNGILFGDYFYGFNGKPLRTRAEKNIDLQFAAEVLSDMEGWDPERVILAGDPVNQAVLHIYDDLSETIVIPFMAQQEQWGAPVHFSGRLLDAAVVNDAAYVTVLSGGNIRVNRWEGGAGIGGTRYIASQYIDPDYALRNTLKNLQATGKIGSMSIYVIEPGVEPPDVSDLGAAAVTFTQSDLSVSGAEEFTHLQGRAYAFRVDFASDDGYLDKLVARGLPKAEIR